MNINDLSISIIVPVFNEEESITEVIDRIKKAWYNCGSPYEIIVVDDGSTDKTFELTVSQDVKVLQHTSNRGYGAALKTGINESKYNWILITDGDGTYPLEQTPSFLEFIPEYDMVVGARTGKNTNIPFMRRPAKWFLRILAGFIAGTKIPDLNSGLRIFRKDLSLEFSYLYPNGFSYTSTITMAFLTHGYNVKYIPINYYKRKGKSSIRAYDFVNFNRLLIKLTLFFKPIKLFSAISGFLFLLALFVLFFSKFYLGQVMDITTIVIMLSSLQIFLFGLLAELVVRLREQK
jgi:glycosyltransferase involved in cell wall biosynthesis